MKALSGKTVVWMLIYVVGWMCSASVLAAIDVYDFDTKLQEEQFKTLSSTLRCPKCQNNTIGDSNAEIAQDLRQKVYEMTKQGQTPEEIVQYMTDRYGNFVTYDPPFTLATAILWFGPVIVLVLGLSVIIARSRKKAQVIQNADCWNPEKEARLQALLDGRKNGDKR